MLRLLSSVFLAYFYTHSILLELQGVMIVVLFLHLELAGLGLVFKNLLLHQFKQVV